jgi:glycerate 2-kinase
LVKILVAPDKFKGSMTASEVCDAVKEFFEPMKSRYTVTTVPLADGGDGTFEFLRQNFDAKIIQTNVHDPLLREFNASYALAEDGSKAFIEMAKASGLQLLKEDERNPLETSTYGTGELIKHALDKGVKEIILGIGGSATNDAGVGMASALGFRFLNCSRKTIINPRGKDLFSIQTIDLTGVNALLNNVAFTTLCDVTNPLTGETGAAKIYGPQKGASPADVLLLEEGLRNFQNVLSQQHNFSCEFPGAGAAGGLGAGAKFFLNSKMSGGFDYLASIAGLQKKIDDADIVITGEGMLDDQSLCGKVVSKVSAMAKRSGKVVLIICGKNTMSSEQRATLGANEILELSAGIDIKTSVENAFELVKMRLHESKIFKI